MSYNEIFFPRYGKKEFLAYAILVLIVLGLIYLLYPKGFWSGLIAGVLYFVIMLFFMPTKYVLTTENTLETLFLFGKMKSRTIDLHKIGSAKIESPNKLQVKYYKEGYSQPSSVVLELEEKDAIDMQNELLKRNPQIALN